MFVLQLGLISLVTVGGVLAAGLVAERLLVRQALVGEADWFWQRRSDHPGHPLPDTLNLRSWFIGAQDAAWEPTTATDPATLPPPELRALLPGQHSVQLQGERVIAHVSEVGGERLFLVFDSETVSTMAFWFGIVPIALVLLFMYSLAYLAYRLSSRAVSPMVRLAERIGSFDFNARDAAELELDAPHDGSDTETRVLTEAIGHFVSRSKASIERERDFTRFASHELRTPVAVMRGSIAQLELMPLHGASARALERIKRSSGHMATLIESLLVLARDHGSGAHPEPVTEAVPLWRLVQRLMDELAQTEPADDRRFHLSGDADMRVLAPEAVLQIVIGNLLANAWRHGGQGAVHVHIGERSLSVSDQGPGLDAEQRRRVFEPFYRLERDAAPSAGSGLGLALVQRVTERYGWHVRVTSRPGHGATFLLDFATDGAQRATASTSAVARR